MAMGLRTTMVCQTIAMCLKRQERTDPMIPEPVKLMTTWLATLASNKAFLERILAKALLRPNIADLINGKNGWPAATGPTTGLLKNLCEYGWHTASPTTWSLEDDVWQRGKHSEEHVVLIDSFSSTIDERLWAEAAGHRLGSGLLFGPPMLQPVIDYIEEQKRTCNSS